jgi:hypothetical protein
VPDDRDAAAAFEHEVLAGRLQAREDVSPAGLLRLDGKLGHQSGQSAQHSRKADAHGTRARRSEFVEEYQRGDIQTPSSRVSWLPGSTSEGLNPP